MALLLTSIAAAAMTAQWSCARKRAAARATAEDPSSVAFLASQVDRRGQPLAASDSQYFAGVADYKVMMTAAEIEQALIKTADRINNDFVGEKIVLCCILKGAFVYACDLVKHLNRPYSLYFVEASSYKGQKQSDEVELLSRIVPEKFEGRRVILIDELLDNGETMDTMQNHLVKILGVDKSQIVKCVLFEKENPRRAEHLAADIVGIRDLPELWLVGYGLDDNGTKRGWPLLYAKKKADGIPPCPEDVIFDDTQAGRDMYATIRRKIAANIAAE